MQQQQQETVKTLYPSNALPGGASAHHTGLRQHEGHDSGSDAAAPPLESVHEGFYAWTPNSEDGMPRLVKLLRASAPLPLCDNSGHMSDGVRSEASLSGSGNLVEFRRNTSVSGSASVEPLENEDQAVKEQAYRPLPEQQSFVSGQQPDNGEAAAAVATAHPSAPPRKEAPVLAPPASRGWQPQQRRPVLIASPAAEAAAIRGGMPDLSGRLSAAEQLPPDTANPEPASASAAAAVPPPPAVSQGESCESQRGGVPGNSPEARTAFEAALKRHWRQEASQDFMHGRCAALASPLPTQHLLAAILLPSAQYYFLQSSAASAKYEQPIPLLSMPLP